MTDKAYGGDIIKIVNPANSASYRVGDIFTVDLRQSDMGACDDEILMTTTDEFIFDNEYIIVEKVNDYHFIKELDEITSKSNEQLLHSFKQGSLGEREFNRFMALVRMIK